MKKIILINLTIVIFIIGCSSSKITTSWKAKDIIVQPYKKIMVIGVIREADRSIQEKMENHIIGDLQNLGYTALSSLKEYGPSAFKKGDTAAALIKLNESGVDAVLTIVLLDKEKEQQYVAANYRNSFIGYRYEMYQRIFEPGYYVTNTKYFWESNLYNLKTKQLIYSVQTQSFNPDDRETLAHEYGKLIVKDMLKEQVLKNENISTIK
jgi:hypothetical protein